MQADKIMFDTQWYVWWLDQYTTYSNNMHSEQHYLRFDQFFGEQKLHKQKVSIKTL